MLISIIVPIYKVEAYIRECIESLILQKCDEIEIILVDDGSPDNCGRICDEFKQKYSKYIKVIHKDNGGLVSAWKAGTLLSKADYLMFVDGDDTLEPFAIKSLIDLIKKNNDLDMICYDFNYIFSKSKSKHKMNMLEPGIYEIKEEGTIIQQILYYRGYDKLIANSRCAKIVRRDIVLNNLNFCLNQVNLGEDQQFTISCVLDCKMICIVDDMYLYNYLQNEASMVHTFNHELWKQINILMNQLKDIFLIKNKAFDKDSWKKEYLMYAIKAINNEFYTTPLNKKMLFTILNDSNVQSGARLIKFSDLDLYDKMITFSIKRRSVNMIKFIRVCFELKQKLKRRK